MSLTDPSRSIVRFFLNDTFINEIFRSLKKPMPFSRHKWNLSKDEAEIRIITEFAKCSVC